MNMKQTLAGLTLAAFGLSAGVQASTLSGGNASINDAESILDIVFAIDTSGSMFDDINAIGSVAQGVINNLNCKSDIYVRARFAGIAGTYGSIFDERMTTILAGNPLVTNHVEDNGPVVTDTVLYYPWHDFVPGGNTATLYKAVVTIGDEGTDNGYGINQSDWDTAVTANSTAIANNTFLFSWVTNDPYPGVPYLFETMATGGPAAAPYTGTCYDTGGAYIEQGSGDSAAIEAALENIICTAGSGGTPGQTPVPAPLALIGLGVLGFGLRKRFA